MKADIQAYSEMPRYVREIANWSACDQRNAEMQVEEDGGR